MNTRRGGMKDVGNAAKMVSGRCANTDRSAPSVAAKHPEGAMTTVSSSDSPAASTPAVPPPSDRSALDVIAATLARAGIDPTDARTLGIDVLADLHQADWLPMNPQLRHFWPVWMKWAAEADA